jgi:molybdopterin-guanine dinucleotide biosynthesis protein A
MRYVLAVFQATAKGYDGKMDERQAQDVTIAILAGGKSSRMGTDKAFTEFRGITMLRRSLDLARSVTQNVCIAGSEQKFGRYAPVVEDEIPDCGPLGGIHAALRSSHTDFNLILAVDMPFVSRSFLQYLISQAPTQPHVLAVVPRCNGRWQPLCALYRRPFAIAAQQALRMGRNKIDLLFDSKSTQSIEQRELETAGFSADVFRNINTPEQLLAGKGAADSI